MKKAQLKLGIFLALFGASGAMVSCDNDDSNDPVRLTAAEFMTRAANSDLFEIQTSKIAVFKGQTPAVKTFAQQMINDHTATSAELKTLATQKKLTLPDSLSADKRVIRTRLSAATGVALDKEYANGQVASHDEAIALYEQAVREVTDAEVKAFATKTLPNLQMHRTHAVQVKTTTDAL